MPTAVVALRVIVEQSALRGEGGARSANDEDEMGTVIVVVTSIGLVRPHLLVSLPERVDDAVAARPTDTRRAIRERLQPKPRMGSPSRGGDDPPSGRKTIRCSS